MLTLATKEVTDVAALHEKRLLLLSDFKQTEIFSTGFSKTTQHKI